MTVTAQLEILEVAALIWAFFEINVERLVSIRPIGQGDQIFSLRISIASCVIYAKYACTSPR